MILVDTAVWVDHLRPVTRPSCDCWKADSCWVTPGSLDELALGHLSQHHEVISLFRSIPQATVATNEEVMVFIDRYQLHGLGIGYVDAQLLAATKLTADAALWTADQRLAEVASRLGCAIDPEPATGDPHGRGTRK